MRATSGFIGIVVVGFLGSVTLTTERRVLVFRSGAVRWTELMRKNQLRNIAKELTISVTSTTPSVHTRSLMKLSPELTSQGAARS